MRVLFVTPWYPSPAHVYSGVFVREHANAARTQGVEIVVLHLLPPSRDQRRIWRLERETDPALTAGITTYRLRARVAPLRGLSFFVRLWALVRAYGIIRAAGFEPDVIHAHVLGAAGQSAILAALHRRPLVITEHSTDFPERLLSRIDRWKARLAYPRARAVLPVCRFLQRSIEAYGIRANFRVVPNAVDTSLFHPAAASAHSPGDGRRRRLLYVGNLDYSPQKAFPVLLDALTLLHDRGVDFALDVVGGGVALDDYARRACDLGLETQIAFHGPRPKPQVAEFMRGADCLVLPSRFENLPCVIIEAMASGLPVVATAVGGIPEMVADEQGILVPPDDPAALAGALERVVSGAAEFDGATIAAYAAARFGLEPVGRELRDVYDAAVRPAR